ncbi:hypothetical protein OQH61_08765 [Helicobacter sp. MIT 21-1697]|uniref:hypothetical protein n=1 Tax=Helicobacter sp. MIT 21-1697 TaxID=2993733 RepID=UPI00224AA996|nr:hypothetical protein [Helicobacter sp. MIT 21-1697]MCX2717822.1 hypothetical protein [Helicobacter sp. MIT 21-1697]
MKKVGFEIIFNVKDGSLQKVNKELDSTAKKSRYAKEQTSLLNKQGSAFGSSIGKLTLGLGALGLAAQGLSILKDVLVQPIKEAVALNAQYENLGNSIASLISINHENITATGEVLSAQEKWQLSLKESQQTIDELKESGLELGYSVSDMSDMFKGFYSTAGASMSLSQAKNAMKAIAAAANVSGVSVDSLKVTLDSLGSGIANTATDFGRFVSAMGLSTEEMSKAKQEGKLYELIMEKLGPLSESAAFSANSYAVNMAKLNSVIDDLKQSAIAPYFENIKNAIASCTDTLSKNKDKIVQFAQAIIEHAQNMVKPFIEFADTLYSTLSEAILFVARAFGYASSEGDAFNVILNIALSASTILSHALSSLVNSIKLVINSFKLLINSAQVAYHAINAALSFGENSAYHTKQIELLNAKDKELKNAIMGNIKGYAEIYASGIEKIKDIWKQKTKEDKQKPKEQSTLVGKSANSANFSKNGANKGTSELDLLRSYFESEFLLREKNIALMQQGKNKELELEILRYDRSITHLNLELKAKIKSGKLSISQANELYSLELKLHEQKMQHIREYSQTYEDLKRNINSALDENINSAFNGKFNNFQSLSTQIFSSMQSSITKGFATSISAAFMETQVMESMTKTLSYAIEGVSSKGALGGIVGQISSIQIGDSNLGEVAGVALAGYGMGNVAGGLVGNFLGDEANAQKTQKSANNGAMAGAAAGAAIGSFVPVIGTAIGGIVGGLVGGIGGALFGSFSSSKRSTTAKGIELTQSATKQNVSAREFADVKETKKKYWGLKKSTSTWREFYAADNQSLRNIKNAIRGYEYLLEDIGGGIKEIVIKQGQYKDYADIVNAGAKELIRSFYDAPSKALKEHHIAPNIDEIYNVWAEYAKSVDKQVSEALSESLTAFSTTGQNFQTWLYNFKGQSEQALKYQEELARKQVQRITDSLGVSDINIDNYLSYREEAIKKGFDPQTIEQINALGEALMQSADASKKYEEALKGENKTKLNLIDPFLEKTKKLEEYKMEQDRDNEKLQVNMLTTLKSLLRTSQENLELLGGGR